jgi:hypothetical protein
MCIANPEARKLEARQEPFIDFNNDDCNNDDIDADSS